MRIYTILGKTNLTDTTEWAQTNSTHRFFKVKVGMPTARHSRSSCA